MDDAGKFNHALMAVLYTLKRAGNDLDDILLSAKQGMIDNSIRPLPQDQEAVAMAIAQAIRDIDPPQPQALQRRQEDIPPASRRPGPALGSDNMPCPDCNGRGINHNGEDCELCQGTGATTRYE